MRREASRVRSKLAYIVESCPWLPFQGHIFSIEIVNFISLYITTNVFIVINVSFNSVEKWDHNGTKC